MVKSYLAYGSSYDGAAHLDEQVRSHPRRSALETTRNSALLGRKFARKTAVNRQQWSAYSS